MINSDSHWNSGQEQVTIWKYLNAETSGEMKNSLWGFRIGFRMRIGENPTFD
jgi:hypothetical protein